MSTPDQRTNPSNHPADDGLPAPRGRSRSINRTPPPPRRDSTALALALVGVILGGLALLLAIAGATGVFAAPASTASCQRLAWAAMPRWTDLQGAFPTSGWSVQAPDLESARLSATLVGPTLSDGSQDAVYVRITCYGGSEGSDALARLKVASTESGTQVTDTAIGSEGFRIDDPTSGLSETFREGNLIGWVLLPAGITDDTDLTPAATALDAAMKRAQAPGGLDIPAPTVPAFLNNTPNPSDAAASDVPTDAPTPAVAPDLEALMPTTLRNETIGTSSSTFDMATANDGGPSSKALVAALAANGKKPTDLLVAEASGNGDSPATPDASGNPVEPLANLESLTAYEVKGMPAATLQGILDSYLGASSAGVKSSTATVGGKSVQVIDYGANTPKAYLYVKGDVVIVLSTVEDALATEVFTALK